MEKKGASLQGAGKKKKGQGWGLELFTKPKLLGKN